MGIIIGIRAGIGGGKRKPDKWLDPVSAEFTRRTSGGSLSVGSRAKIGSVKGRTLVWNQMVKNGDFGTGDISGWTKSTGLDVVVDNGVCAMTKTVSGGLYVGQVVSLIKDHKYFFAFDMNPYNNKNLTFVRDATADEYYGRTAISSGFGEFHRVQQIFVAVADKSNAQIRIYDSSTSDFQTTYVKNVMLIDLTLLGLDYLETAEDFAKLYPAEYYPSTYTGNNYANFSPFLVNNAASAIKTIGFNQWDEVVESGGINRDTGTNTNNENYNRTKNYIPVLQGTAYYLKAPVAMCVIFYDINKNFISSLPVAAGSVFSTPRNAAYLRFRNNGSATWPKYNHDICLNLSYSGSRNGEYQRYWENSLALNLTTITGKAGGDSVVIFPDGMKSVGSVYDELTKTTATKRIGVVDAGELAWTYNSNNTRFYAQLPTAKMGGKILCLGYTSVSASAILSQDKTIAISGVAHSLMLNDTSFDGDAAALTLALAGMKIYYELDEPEVYTLDSPLSLSYRVDSFGTEERLPADTPSELSAPIRIEVSYTEPKPKDIKPVLSGPLLGGTDNGDGGNELNNIDYETDS